MIMEDIKERQVFELAKSLLDKDIPNTSLHYEDNYPEHGDEEIKLFHTKNKVGYGVVIRKEFCNDPDDIGDMEFALDEEGYSYSVIEPYDGFDHCGIDKCIELLKAVEV